MNTNAIQILLHYQDDNIEPQEKFERFLNDVRSLAKKHKIEFDQYESFTLNENDYNIAPCTRCGELTINSAKLDNETKKMVPFFWEFVKSGSVIENSLICQECIINNSDN